MATVTLNLETLAENLRSIPGVTAVAPADLDGLAALLIDVDGIGHYAHATVDGYVESVDGYRWVSMEAKERGLNSGVLDRIALAVVAARNAALLAR